MTEIIFPGTYMKLPSENVSATESIMKINQ